MTTQNVNELRRRRSALFSEVRAIFDRCHFENRGLTADEIKRDDALAKEMAAIAANIARIEGGLGAYVTETRRDKRFGAYRRGDFLTLGELGQALIRAADPTSPQIDPRLHATGVSAGPTGMSEGIGSDGGFLVQSDMADDLLQSVYESGEIARRVARIPVGPKSNGIVINGVDETSRANGSRFGGIQAYWSGEAQLLTASQPKFRKLKMDLQKLTGLCYATDEVLRDSTALGAWLEQAFTEEFTFKIEDAIINGLGTGMPLGFLNSGAVVTVSAEGSQVAATIVAENILKMWARMPARSRKNAVWLCNQDIEPQLYQLNVKIKNVAGSENVGGIATLPVVFNPPGSVPGQEMGLLMGRPVIPVEYCPSLGTAGDIMLVDLSQYLMIDKGGIDAQSSIHVRFIYDEMAFRFIYRANGQPIWTSPMTPYKGTATQSPFIVLATRA